MSLETASFIHQLNPSNPSGADKLKEGDDHIRLLKAVLRNTFPGLNGPLDPSITPEFLKGLAGQLVPAGIISLWHGAADKVPTGWALCDGTEVPASTGGGTVKTPDLRGRVPVGVSADYALLSTFGNKQATITTETAGAHTHEASTAAAGGHDHGGKTGDVSLTVDQMPNHDHGNGIVDNDASFFPYGTKPSPPKQLDPAGASHGTVAIQGITEAVGGGKPHSHTITAVEAHSHTVTVKQADGHAHKATLDLLQPSIALHFIIKV